MQSHTTENLYVAWSRWNHEITNQLLLSKFNQYWPEKLVNILHRNSEKTFKRISCPLHRINKMTTLKHHTLLWNANNSLLHITELNVKSISNTKERVWQHFQTPRRELKIWRAAEYFWWGSFNVFGIVVKLSLVCLNISSQSKLKLKTKLLKSILIIIRYPNTGFRFVSTQDELFNSLF